VWQLAQRVDENDVRDFFSRAGRIRDVRLIMDRRSRRHKGQGYVEFYHARSVPASITYNGEAICGFPVAIKSIGGDIGKLPAGIAKYSSAVPVEIPQLPPPTMPLESPSAPTNQVQISCGQHNLPSSREHTSEGYDTEVRTAATAVPEVANTRLVSIEELAVLLNPHGLPIITASSVPGATITGGLAVMSKETPVSSISLPESQQVPLPIPGRHVASPPAGAPAPVSGLFKRLYVGSVPFTVSEDDLMTIFRPFGEIVSFQLQREAGTGRSRGYGFVEFAAHESAKKALDLNGLVIAGRSLKVNLASATNIPSASLPSLPQGSTVPLPGPAGRSTAESSNHGDLSGELDDGRDGGLAMNASQRALLMQRLSRGEDMGTATDSVAGHSTQDGQTPDAALPPISYNTPCQTTTESSRCLLLSNMFDPVAELKGSSNFELEVAEDVRDEVSTKYGPVKHLFVDKYSRGLVYITLDSIAASSVAKAGLNGRWFGGNRVTAEFVDEHEYKKRNPEADI
jgi:RNA recognition motif-containing protein